MRTITIHEETLRDGEQAPGVNFLREEKVKIAQALAEMLPGCILNAGYPPISRAEFEAVQAVARQTAGAQVFCTGRASEADLRLCHEAVREGERPRISFWVPVSGRVAMTLLGKTQKEILELARQMLSFGRGLSDGRIPVDVALSDASRTEPEFLHEICDMLTEEGVGVLFICDTVGYMAVTEFASLIAGIKQAVPQTVIGAHVHNDLGLATASALAALLAGADVISTTVNGISEGAGMPATEEIIANLLLRRDFYQLECQADPTKILSVSRLVAEASGIPPSACKPVVGSAVHAVETGSHLGWVGIPSEWLRVETQILIGKMSTHGSIRARLEQLGETVSDAELDRVFQAVKELTGRQKRVSDADLLAMVAQARAG